MVLIPFQPRSLETLHTMFCIIMVYTYFVTHFGDETVAVAVIW